MEINSWFEEYVNNLVASKETNKAQNISYIVLLSESTLRSELKAKLLTIYQEEDAEKILAIYDKALSDINSATKISDLNGIKDTFINDVTSTVSYIDSLNNQSSEETPNPLNGLLMVILLLLGTVILLSIVVSAVIVIRYKRGRIVKRTQE